MILLNFLFSINYAYYKLSIILICGKTFWNAIQEIIAFQNVDQKNFGGNFYYKGN